MIGRYSYRGLTVTFKASGDPINNNINLTVTFTDDVLKLVNITRDPMTRDFQNSVVNRINDPMVPMIDNTVAFSSTVEIWLDALSEILFYDV
ncbi:MAG: hypothetical protein Ta2E_10690 [Mycoplasmoidaceae bacterium]|nr:MAG: hypothetical protein Ta2E_10690 [Mycoplasmoidaceae bacterium]